MLRLIVIRLLQLPLILAVIFAVTFTLAWLIPGNPLQTEGRRPPPEVEAAMLRQYNLDSPWNFLRSYLSDAVRGDFGPSLQYPGERVSDMIIEALPISAELGVAALIVALFIGTVAGVLGALRPRSLIDASSLAVALVGVSLPSFVTGSVLLIVFAGLLAWFPIGNWYPVDWRVDQIGVTGVLQSLGRHLWHLALPALTLGVAPAAYIARLIRLGLADIMSSDYIRTARAKGLSRRRALFRHAMKVAYLPVLSFLGPAAAAAMTGSFVVEKVFNIPGMGDYFVTAVLTKDQFLILGIVLTYSTMLVLFNLVVDVAYAWLDPRIEL